MARATRKVFWTSRSRILRARGSMILWTRKSRVLRPDREENRTGGTVRR